MNRGLGQTQIVCLRYQQSSSWALTSENVVGLKFLTRSVTASTATYVSNEFRGFIHSTELHYPWVVYNVLA